MVQTRHDRTTYSNIIAGCGKPNQTALARILVTHSQCPRGNFFFFFFFFFFSMKERVQKSTFRTNVTSKLTKRHRNLL